MKQRTRPVPSGCPYCAGKRVLPLESFAARYPSIAGEWHPTKNMPLQPEAIACASNKRVWWRCAVCGHDWATAVAHRTGQGTGCPGCAGTVVVPGRSLADRSPELAGEWHPTRNGALRPTAVAPRTTKRAWWQCAHCGNEWLASVAGRVGGKGCSTCRPPGWSSVAIQIGAELATLVPVGDLERAPREVRREVGWEPDLVIPTERIALDVDGRFWHGDGHHKTRDSRDRDVRKAQVFHAVGWRLVRIREHPLTPLSANDVVVADLRDTKATTITVVEHLRDRCGLVVNRLADYRAASGLAGQDAADTLIAAFQRGDVAGRTLAELFPMVAAEWHPTRNGVLRPDTVYAGSSRSVWWRCAVGRHVWAAKVLNRSHGTGCPYCSGNKAGQGNTLADLHPELAAEWHPSRNGELTPAQVTPGTTNRGWWRCSQGHEWQASIASRVAGRGCSQCSGRVASPERNLLVVDPGLAAEWHLSRNSELTPVDVTPGSGRRVWWSCVAGHEWEAAIVVRRSGDGCPYCSRHRVGQGNSLADLRPDVAAQWHPTLNGRLTAADVSPRSHRRVWWLCASDHTWAASVGRRVDGIGCPYCSGRLAGQGNTLADIAPAVAAQWHPTLNGECGPDGVAATSLRTASWRCAAGHEWQAPVRSRVAGSRCPFCAGRRATPERNLAILYPELATQWHRTRNGDLTAEQVTPGSDRAVWWVCDARHEWQASIANRVAGRGCPCCAGRGVGHGNSLADRHPHLAAQWHPTRNGTLTTAQLTPGASTRVWWTCNARHEWQASVNSRVHGTGCPACSGRQATAEMNLVVTHPALAAEWHPSKNGNLLPSQLRSGSNKRAWWQCAAGHEWEATLLNRSRGGSGCPFCSGRRATPDRNLAAQFPELARVGGADPGARCRGAGAVPPGTGRLPGPGGGRHRGPGAAASGRYRQGGDRRRRRAAAGPDQRGWCGGRAGRTGGGSAAPVGAGGTGRRHCREHRGAVAGPVG